VLSLLLLWTVLLGHHQDLWLCDLLFDGSHEQPLNEVVEALSPNILVQRQTDRHKSSGYISRYKEWEMTATDKQLNCYPPLDVLQYEVSLNAVSTRREPDVECCLGRKCETSRRHLCPVQGAVQYTPGCSVLEKMAFWSYSSNTCEFHHFTVTVRELVGWIVSGTRVRIRVTLILVTGLGQDFPKWSEWNYMSGSRCAGTAKFKTTKILEKLKTLKAGASSHHAAVYTHTYMTD